MMIAPRARGAGGCVLSLERKRTMDSVLGGLLLSILKPATMLLGAHLARDHAVTPRQDIVVLKFVGGGSLLIALPALLGIKRSFPGVRLTLVTTAAVRQFADVLGVFDDIVTIDDRSVASLASSATRALWAAFRRDTIIDLEVYSRMSAIFATLTMARNRIGFYLASRFWRKGLHTHLVYYSVFAGTYLLHEQIAYLLGATPASVDECRALVLRSITPDGAAEASPGRLVIGPGCSDFGRERMLTAGQWGQLLDERLRPDVHREVLFLGTAGDAALANAVIAGAAGRFPGVAFRNLCGQMKLRESLALLATAQEFWGIDSALLHFARLFRLRCFSIWGPTRPDTRLKPMPGLDEEVRYRPITCSPCIHITEAAPCDGFNQCINQWFDATVDVSGPRGLFTVWPPAAAARSRGTTP